MERMFFQAWKTVFLKFDELENKDTINPFNMNVNQKGFCPSLTTRPEGFKTCIAIVEIIEE